MDLQAEYDNRARVPGHPAIIAGWQRDAAAWRDACPRAELALAYGERGREKLDLFWPHATGDAVSIAMFIHGGYWQALGREWVSHCARGLNARGVAVAVPSYDLCPAVPLATIVGQMQAAAAWLFQRHGRPVLAAGHSAGGHLAAMLLATDWPARGLPAGMVSGALAISGVFELEPLRATSIGTGLALDAGEALALSPRWMPRPAGPIHCVVGGAESGEFIRQSRDMAAAWAGDFATVPGADHFTVLAPLSAPASELVTRAEGLAAA